MSNAVGQFISIVALCFPKPRFEAETDEELWVGLMVRTLGHYEPAVLAKAADAIVRTRDRKRDGAFFPLPNECIEACEKAKRAAECRDVPRLAVDKVPPGFSPERHKLAVNLLGTGLGEQALNGRWHGALYDFIYANMRLPQGREIDDVRRKSKEFFEAVRACELGARGSLSPRLAKLGNAIAGKRDKYVEDRS